MSEQNVYPICETAAGFFGKGEDSKSEKEMYNWVSSAKNERSEEHTSELQ